MNQLDKIDFTVYLRKGQRYNFLKYIEEYSDEGDFFIFYKDKSEIIGGEKIKIKERVDRWIEEKSDIIPDKESWEIWRWAKLYDECKADYLKVEQAQQVQAQQVQAQQTQAQQIQAQQIQAQQTQAQQTQAQQIQVGINPFDKH